MKFNHLNVPNHWKHEFTKYPEGFTILEALIQWVQQVDKMVDSQNNLTDRVDKHKKDIDDFIKNFDKSLQTTVTAILSEWQHSGFLNVVINEALQTQIDDVAAQLAETEQQVQKIKDRQGNKVISIEEYRHLSYVQNNVRYWEIAIQTAINENNNYSTITFLATTYHVRDKIIWDGRSYLKGMGKKATYIRVHQDAVAYDNMFEKTDEANTCCDIVGISFNGNMKVDRVLDFKRGKNPCIRKNEFKNAKIEPLRFGGATWGAYECDVYENTIIGMEMNVSGYDPTSRPTNGINITSNCTDSRFYHNIILCVKTNGILNNGSNNEIKSNHIYASLATFAPDHGIQVGGKFNLVHHNHIDTMLKYGVVLNNHRNTITENSIFWNNAVISDMANAAGIAIFNSSGWIEKVNVTENLINGSATNVGFDVLIIGTVPKESTIENNYGNVQNNGKYANRNVKGMLNVEVGVLTLRYDFLYPHNDWGFNLQATPNWDCGTFWARADLTGITFTWTKGPTQQRQIYWKLEKV